MKLLALVGLAAAVNVGRWDRKYGKENPHPGFSSDSDGFDGRWQYTRVVPDHVGGPGSGDDQFNYSMIKNYAMEEATPDGHPTGEFYMNKAGAFMAA